jgi:hypothetical protein
LQGLKATGARIIEIGANPFVPESPGLCLSRRDADPSACTARFRDPARDNAEQTPVNTEGATFIDIAYAIVNVEHSFAGPAEVRLNDRHFPFAKANQILTWRRETGEELLSLFDEIYAGVRPDGAMKPGTAAVTVQQDATSRMVRRVAQVAVVGIAVV